MSRRLTEAGILKVSDQHGMNAVQQQDAADKRRLGRALGARTSLMRRLPLILVLGGRGADTRG
jgi:hypothetical protein